MPVIDAGDFLRVESARGTLDVATLRRDVVEVREVTLEGVLLTLEETGTGSNYDPIVANLERGARPASDAPGPSVRVHHLYVRDITAQGRAFEWQIRRRERDADRARGIIRNLHRRERVRHV